MKVTIADIAKITKCSASTVSKALSDSSDINNKTKEEILQCAIDLGYDIGRKKAKSKGTIAAVIQTTELSSIRFEYNMLFGFKLMATRGGYDVEIVQRDAGDNHWSFTKEVVDKGFCGAFLLRFGNGTSIFEEICKCSLPVVVFDEVINTPNAAYIGCDSELGIKLAVRHLVELGHKKIAFYGGSPTAHVSVIRKKSFIAALRDSGLEVFPELIAESNFSQNYAPKIIPDFIEFSATAIVCASDLLASFALDEIKRLGLSVPNDISLIGFDNVPLSEETCPKLTTIEQNIPDIGKCAFHMLEHLINKMAVGQLLFKPKLIVRESTCKPKA